MPKSEDTQRLTRIETRLVKLGEVLGINLKNKEKVVCDPEAMTATIDAVDVSLSTIINCATEAGVKDEWVDIMYKGERLGEIWAGNV